MGDDKPVIAFVLLLDGLCNGQPVGGLEVGAVEIEELDGVDVTERRDFRDGVQQFPGGQLRRQALVRLFGGDGSAGGKKQNPFHRVPPFGGVPPSLTILPGNDEIKQKKIIHLQIRKGVL